jgi:hypothetical protein
MEHIVQFAISIDDDTIAKRVCENAEKVITNSIQKEVEGNIFRNDYYAGRRRTELTSEAESIILAWLDSNKDEIIQHAGKLLADKLAKTKAAKTVLEEVLNNDKT